MKRAKAILEKLQSDLKKLWSRLFVLSTSCTGSENAQNAFNEMYNECIYNYVDGLIMGEVVVTYSKIKLIYYKQKICFESTWL